MSDEYAHPRPLALPTARRWAPVLAALALLAVVPASQAASSPIGASPDDELTQSQILEHLYGGSFAPEGDDFSNGSVEVTRIDDGSGAEQIFQGDVVSARAVAAFSRNTEATVGSVTGGEFEPLFTVSGRGLDVTGSAELSGPDLRTTMLALKSGGNVRESNGAGNAHPLKAYSVTGADVNSRKFVLFWEDAAAPYSDFDYNDLVVELGGAAGGRGSSNVLIPLPAAAWSGLSLLGGVSLMAGCRRLRQRLVS